MEPGVQCTNHSTPGRALETAGPCCSGCSANTACRLTSEVAACSGSDGGAVFVSYQRRRSLSERIVSAARHDASRAEGGPGGDRHGGEWTEEQDEEGEDTVGVGKGTAQAGISHGRNIPEDATVRTRNVSRFSCRLCNRLTVSDRSHLAYLPHLERCCYSVQVHALSEAGACSPRL